MTTTTVADQNLAIEMIERGQAGAQPAGLALLEKVNGLYVSQQWQVLETVTCGCYESANHYKVYDGSGKVELYAIDEKTACCWRQWCGEHRPFTMNVVDKTGAKNQRMMVLKRPYACCGWAIFPCCQNQINVHYVVDGAGQEIHHHGADTLIARVYVPWLGGCCVPTLNIEDRNSKHMATINGPCCCVTDFCGADFSINDANGQKIGEIVKLRPHSLKDVLIELNTDADNFKITFPLELDPTLKMAILASLMQIDFAFFEDERSPAEGRCCACYCCGWPIACCPRWITACCLCCAPTKEEREEEKKRKEQGHGAPEGDDMDR